MTRRRFSIWVTEFGSAREVELCGVDGDPAPTVAGLKAKVLVTRTGRAGGYHITSVPKYTKVRVVDNGNGTGG